MCYRERDKREKCYRGRKRDRENFISRMGVCVRQSRKREIVRKKKRDNVTEKERKREREKERERGGGDFCVCERGRKIQ